MVYTDQIDALHPDLQGRCREFVAKLLRELGPEYRVYITCTYRSADAQRELYKSGRGQHGLVLTHNKPGESPHGAMRDSAGERVPAARAFDFEIKWLGKSVLSCEQEYQIAGRLAAEMGLLWGGRSAAKNREPGHVELPDGWQ